MSILLHGCAASTKSPSFLTLQLVPVLGTANRMLSSHYWLKAIVKWCGSIPIPSSHATVVVCSRHSTPEFWPLHKSQQVYRTRVQKSARRAGAWKLVEAYHSL